MANFKEFKVKLTVDTGDGTKQIEQTISSLNQYEKTLDDLNKKKASPGLSAQELADIDKQIQNLNKSFKDSGNKVLLIDKNLSVTQGNLKALIKEQRTFAVGSEEYRRAADKIADFKDQLEGAKRTQISFSEQLEAAPGPIGRLFSGLDKIKNSFTTLGGAIKASGIGLLVSIIGGITAAFAGNENAMKKLQPLFIGLQKILGGLFRVFEPLLDSFMEMAEVALPYITKGIGIFYSSLVGLFTYIKEAGTGLAKIYQGIFTLDPKKVTEGVDQIKNSFQTAAKAGTDAYARFTQGTQELTKIEKEELEKRKEQEKKDKEDRDARNKKAADDKLQQQKDTINASIELEKNKANTDAKILEDLLKQKDDLENKGKVQSKKVLDKQAADRKKAVEEALKTDADFAKQQEEQRKETYKKLLDQLATYLANEQKEIETKRNINNKKDLQGLKQKLIDGQITQQEFDNQSRDMNIKFAEQKAKDDEGIYNRQQARLIFNWQSGILGYNEYIDAIRKLDSDYEIQKQNNDIAITDAKQERDLTNRTNEIAANKAFQDQMINLEKAYTQTVIDQKMAVADAIGTLGGIISAFAGDSKEAAIAGLLIQQGASVGQILTQSAASIAQTIAQANAIPAFIGPGIPNPAFILAQLAAKKSVATTKISAGIGVGAAIASTIQGVMQINDAFNKKKEEGKKQFGGVLEGPLHQMGGITTPFGELEGGEYVINRASTMMFRPTLDKINSLGGGEVNYQAQGFAPNAGVTTEPPIFKTYVVASEMSSQQELDRVIKDRSKF